MKFGQVIQKLKWYGQHRQQNIFSRWCTVPMRKVTTPFNDHYWAK
jgi:hypothetical protein